MRAILKRAAFCLIFILLFSVVSYAWEDEILKGIYTYESKNLSIKFEWGDDGVEKLQINGRVHPKATYDNLGVFGDSALIRIRAEESPSRLEVIDLLFFVNNGKPLVISGHYIDMRNVQADGSFTTALAKAIEMHYAPFHSRTLAGRGTR